MRPRRRRRRRVRAAPHATCRRPQPRLLHPQCALNSRLSLPRSYLPRSYLPHSYLPRSYLPHCVQAPQRRRMRTMRLRRTRRMMAPCRMGKSRVLRARTDGASGTSACHSPLKDRARRAPRAERAVAQRVEAAAQRRAAAVATTLSPSARVGPPAGGAQSMGGGRPSLLTATRPHLPRSRASWPTTPPLPAKRRRRISNGGFVQLHLFMHQHRFCHCQNPDAESSS